MTAGLCAVCGEGARHCCAACMRVSYCSREHQKSHWNKHKPHCAPYKVEEVKDLGRCLVAVRSIGRGSTALREKPLARGPSEGGGPVCLGCYVPLTQVSFECPHCGWPFCSKACSSSADHRPECRWAQDKRQARVRITQFVTPHPTYGCIMCLRALYLRDNRPAAWKALNSLESHTKERAKEKERMDSERFSIAGLLRRFYKLDKDFTEDEILHVCGIIQINSHEIPLSEPSHIAIYWHGSLVEHSCTANCSKSFSDSGELILRAAKNIARGDRLSICYSDGLWSTPLRRRHLAATKYFNCQCPRCSDPTEFGTYFSAIRCFEKDCEGMLLPETFLTGKPMPWRCAKCRLEATAETVARLIGELSASAVAARTAQSEKNDLLPWKNQLAKAEAEVGVTGQASVEAAMALAQGLGQPYGLQSLGPADLSLKESLVRRLLPLINTLIPGECRLLGVLNFELQATLIEKYRRESANMNPDAIRMLLKEAKQCLEECLHQLAVEPDCLPEGQIRRQAEENLRDLSALLRSSFVDALVV